MGKGSKQRPVQDRDRFSSEYDRIFSNNQEAYSPEDSTAPTPDDTTDTAYPTGTPYTAPHGTIQEL